MRFRSTAGSGLVGSDGYGAVVRKRQDYNPPAALFIGSGYALNFPAYGTLPEANKKEQKKFLASPGKIDGKSQAKRDFDGSNQELHFARHKDE